MTMHADTADMGYGGALGPRKESAGSPGLREGQGFWTAEYREESIALRELRAERLLLHRHFADFVSRPELTNLLLHEGN